MLAASLILPRRAAFTVPYKWSFNQPNVLILVKFLFSPILLILFHCCSLLIWLTYFLGFNMNWHRIACFVPMVPLRTYSLTHSLLQKYRFVHHPLAIGYICASVHMSTIRGYKLPYVLFFTQCLGLLQIFSAIDKPFPEM